jgi:hypothetical protein
MESPLSVTVAEADFDVSAWLVAVTVTELVELSWGTVILMPLAVAFPPIETVCGELGVDKEVAAGAV